MQDNAEPIYATFIGKMIIVRYSTEEGARTAKGTLSRVEGSKLLIQGTYNQWILDASTIQDMNLLKQG